MQIKFPSTVPVTLGIATYNRDTLLKRVLNALQNQTLDSNLFEILICDSHSSDNTEQVICDFAKKNPFISISHLHTLNILACKRNIAIRSSRYPVVIFLDDDCIPDPDFLEVYSNAFSANTDPNEKIVLCGEVVFPRDWVKTSNYYRFRDSLHRYTNKSDRNNLDFNRIVVMNMGFLKNNFLETVQFVDERFKGYGCEDIELGWRLISNGYIIKKLPARVTHFEPSGDINGYCKKIFHTARDGSSTLLQINPQCYADIDSKYKLIDPTLDFNPIHVKILRRIVFLILRQGELFNFITAFLRKTDNLRIFYCPFLFKLVLAHSFYQGALARSNKSLSLSSNWYE